MTAPKFTTLGCRLNAYETEAMKELATTAGVQNAVVVNTCAVTAEAVRKAKQEIRKLRRENPDATVIVTGCAAQTEPATFAAMPEVSRVIGNTEKMQAATWAGMTPDLIGTTEPVQVDDIMSVTDLVMRILRLVPDLRRLRISSIDSIEVDDNLMLAIATEPRLMPHLHLSLQHGDDLILKRMKRRHLRDDAIKFSEDARKLRPDMTFGADIIAGFPTETEAHFENSLKLVDDCALTWLHVFPYSARQGTPAAKMPAVNGKDIKTRAARLRAAGDAQVQRHLAAQQGKIHHILMENTRMGRTEQFTEVSFASDHPESAIISAVITGQSGHQLTA